MSGVYSWIAMEVEYVVCFAAILLVINYTIASLSFPHMLTLLDVQDTERHVICPIWGCICKEPSLWNTRNKVELISLQQCRVSSTLAKVLRAFI
jgi:hypothetical protein